MPKTPFEELFADADVIYTYNDEDALRDGVLVAFDGPTIGFGEHPRPRVNRVTRALWDALTSTIGGVMTDITALARGLEAVASHGRSDGDWRIGELRIEGALRVIWLIPNEVNGYTAMFPEDY